MTYKRKLMDANYRARRYYGENMHRKYTTVQGGVSPIRLRFLWTLKFVFVINDPIMISFVKKKAVRLKNNYLEYLLQVISFNHYGRKFNIFEQSLICHSNQWMAHEIPL